MTLNLGCPVCGSTGVEMATYRDVYGKRRIACADDRACFAAFSLRRHEEAVGAEYARAFCTPVVGIAAEKARASRPTP